MDHIAQSVTKNLNLNMASRSHQTLKHKIPTAKSTKALSASTLNGFSQPLWAEKRANPSSTTTSHRFNHKRKTNLMSRSAASGSPASERMV